VPAWPAARLDGNAEARISGNRRDDADRQIGLEQHRALLDMDLEIAGDVVLGARQRRNR